MPAQRHRENLRVERAAMTDFWRQNSQKASMQEMFLDSRGETLSEHEQPEILSYLPDVTGKCVTELGAGIGRFTAVLAQTAKKVVAVDFMEEFVRKNKATNGHLGHVEVIQADVTQLEQAEDSADLVFSNWLLMYLDDEEVQQLLLRILTWLREGGHLFVRESCNRQSGDLSYAVNPTKYRLSTQYDALFAAATVSCDENSVFGFDLVFSKSVNAYIKLKQNRHQVVWLLQKVRRPRQALHGYQTFQEFLDNQQYSSKDILRYEKIFGRNFISSGGLETTKEFVERLGLQKGQRVLDVGCGIGGSAFYMIKKYGVNVVGMDLSANMVRIGQQRAEEEGIRLEDMTFETADVTRREYPPESFDVIYSRETILYVDDKLSLFKKFFRWLKPGGKVLISDYCQKEGQHSAKFRDYVKQRGYHLLSPRQYGQVLEEAGFVRVKAEDRTEQFLQVLVSELARTEEIQDTFVKEFSQEDFDHTVMDWREMIQLLQQGDHRWGSFYAEKQ